MTAKIVAFGGYDTRKPRVRLLVDALRRAGTLEDEILIDAWSSVAETNVPSRLNILKVIAKIALGYPRAIWRLAQSPKGAAVLLPYPGIIEILILAPIAWLMRRPVVLDAFLPIYDTIAGDRGIVKRGLVSGAIWWFERLALKRADLILVDTDQHGAYFAKEFGISSERFVTVLVGAEPQFALNSNPDGLAEDILGERDERPIVLFYGQLIPLHGVPTIIEAAKLSSAMNARWVIIGKGQLEALLRDRIAREGQRNIEWIEWVDYARLPAVIARADICLGVFGASDKAARVIPNKLFQQAAMGKPIITRASPAVDALAKRFPQSLQTVPANDPSALAKAVDQALSGKDVLVPMPDTALRELSPDAGVARLIEKLSALR